MHAHQRDVDDAFLPAKVVNLLAVVADAIEPCDVDGRVLAGPGPGRTRIRLHHGIIATTGAVVDGELPFFLGIPATARRDWKWGGRHRSPLHAQPLRRSFIEL